MDEGFGVWRVGFYRKIGMGKEKSVGLSGRGMWGEVMGVRGENVGIWGRKCE